MSHLVFFLARMAVGVELTAPILTRSLVSHMLVLDVEALRNG